MPNSPSFCFVFTSIVGSSVVPVCGQAWPRVLQKDISDPDKWLAIHLKYLKFLFLACKHSTFLFLFLPCLWLWLAIILQYTHLSNCIIILFLHFNCISNDNSQHFSFGCCVANGAICKMEIERKNESTRHDVELLGKCLTFFHLPLALVALCAQKYADSFAFFSSSFPFHFWEKWMRVWEILARAT